MFENANFFQLAKRPFAAAPDSHWFFPSSSADQALQARAQLDQLMAGKRLHAHAVFQFFPAQRRGDDIVLYTGKVDCLLESMAKGFSTK